MHSSTAHMTRGANWRPHRGCIRVAANLVVIAATYCIMGEPCADAQGPLVAWGDDRSGVVSGIPAGRFDSVTLCNGAYDAFYAVAIRDDGTLAAWGIDIVGVVSGIPAGTFRAVAAGAAHAVAIRTDGTLFSWGEDSYGQVSATPAGGFSAVAAGSYHTVAIRTDGTLFSWGDDSAGQVSGTPAGTFTGVAAGFSSSVAIRTDGTLAVWGTDIAGGILTPPLGTFTDVAAGVEHMVAIRTDGTLAAWNSYGPFGTPAGTYSDVAGGAYHSVAVRTDGTLVSWGGPDFYGEVSGTPTGTFSAVATRGFTNVAIADSGNQAPVIMCNGPTVLWAPDHSLTDISSAIGVSDPDGDPVMLNCRVFSDETEIPDTGDGTGRHAPDFKTILQSGARGVFVRSERRATGDGRYYILVITADDGNGGVSTAVCIAAVCPHDQTQESLDAVLAQATSAVATVQTEVNNNTLPPTPNAPPGLIEHGLSDPLGPMQ